MSGNFQGYVAYHGGGFNSFATFGHARYCGGGYGGYGGYNPYYGGGCGSHVNVFVNGNGLFDFLHRIDNSVKHAFGIHTDDQPPRGRGEYEGRVAEPREVERDNADTKDPSKAQYALSGYDNSYNTHTPWDRRAMNSLEISIADGVDGLDNKKADDIDRMNDIINGLKASNVSMSEIRELRNVNTNNALGKEASANIKDAFAKYLHDHDAQAFADVTLTALNKDHGPSVPTAQGNRTTVLPTTTR